MRLPEPEVAVVAEPKQVRLPHHQHGTATSSPRWTCCAGRRQARPTAATPATMAALERTFRDFGVPAAGHRRPPGPYRHDVRGGGRAPGPRSTACSTLGDDIAYALATPDVRIIAPIPGKSAIGVEVPNKVREFVTLGDVLWSKAARELHQAPVRRRSGKDVHGRAVLVNLAEMPHLLIAGATGAGKSCVHQHVRDLAAGAGHARTR